MRRVYAIRKQDKFRYWNDVLGGTYLSTAGFVITRFKIEDRSAFKISVSASLFSEASS